MIVTSGPTHEPIDPVRYIANRSSGKQGHAIAAAPQQLGAEVTLVSGPVESARSGRRQRRSRSRPRGEMLAAVEKALPADVAIFAAAVADWRVDKPQRQQDQEAGRRRAAARAGRESRHPRDGRAAQGRRGRGWWSDSPPRPITSSSTPQAKLARKGCDWIVANDVSAGHRRHGRRPQHRPPRDRATAWSAWPPQSKNDVARGARCADRRRADAEAAHEAVELRVLRLPHGARSAAAGLPERARCRARPARGRAGRCAGARSRPARAPRSRPASRSRCRPGPKARCGRARASRCATASPCSTRRARSTPTIAAKSRSS